MDLRSTQLKDTYGNLVTTGTTAGAPTSGGLQNGQGTLLSSVGIGTNSPNEALEVNGNSRFSGYLQITTTTTTPSNTSNPYIERQGAGGIKIASRQSSNSDAIITFDTVATERMRINSGGDISFRDGATNEAFYWDASAGSLGIGTTSPVAPLDVDANSSATNLNLRSRTGSDFSNLNFSTDDGATILANIGSVGDSLRISTGGLTSLTERMRIDSSGNVGVGVSPNRLLHLYGGADTTWLLMNNDATGSASTDGFSIAQVGADVTFINRETGYISFQTSDVPRMTIDSSGNVGIGDVPKTQHSNITDSLNVGSHLTFQRTKDTYIASNFYYNSSDVGKSIASGWSPIYLQDVINGTHQWFNASASATGADETVSLQPLMTLDSSGTLIINSNASSGVVTTNFKAFANDSDAFVEVRNNTNNSADLRIQNSAASEVFLLNGHNGNLTILGALSKGSGSFKIDHPLESKKDTHYLVHSFVESPQANNIYRGSVDLIDGQATVNLDEVSGMTDGTFVLLNTDIHVYTSNESDWDAVKGSVSDNVLTIECQNPSSTAKVNWLVIGERHDQHMIETDWTDENGKVIVEPLKPIENELEN
jgi:hypothetical protein